MPDPIEHLSSLFEKFPGIGPRQAGRFVQYLLRAPASTRRELIELVRNLGSDVHQCPDCLRFFSGKKGLCDICRDEARDQSLLAIVASDADLLALERSDTYDGRYCVIGGLVSLASEKSPHLRMHELQSLVTKHAARDLAEIILAFPANPEGDATGQKVRDELAFLIEKHSLRVSTLGRGLSTGSELEYADPETLKSALENRH